MKTFWPRQKLAEKRFLTRKKKGWKLVQGALEASNVNVVQELVEMIETQRAYEVSSKAITSVDEMLRFIANNL